MLEAKGIDGGAEIARGPVKDPPLLREPQSADEARRAASWVQSRLGRMEREGGFAELDVLVTPALASALLEINTKNRHLKQSPLSVIQRALEAGRWINTGHPVVISWDRLMQDGQHRLNAIINTSIPATIDIRFGVDPRAFTVTDTGTKRSGGDVMEIAGYSQTNTMAAAARLILAIRRGSADAHYGYATDPTNDVLLKFADENPNLAAAARIGHSSRASLKIRQSAVAAAAFIIAEAVGVPATEEFFVAARKKLNIASSRDPLKVLEKVLESGDLRSPAQVVAALIVTFNKRQIRKSASSKDLILQSGEPFPSVTTK